MLMSVGVILAATIIYFRPDMWYADPICTYCFAVMIVFTSYPTLKRCIVVLMEGAPDSIDPDDICQKIYDLNQDDITDVHDLHIWQISQGKLSMSVHVKSKTPLKTLAYVTDMCKREYNLHHTTI